MPSNLSSVGFLGFSRLRLGVVRERSFVHPVTGKTALALAAAVGGGNDDDDNDDDTAAQRLHCHSATTLFSSYRLGLCRVRYTVRFTAASIARVHHAQHLGPATASKNWLIHPQQRPGQARGRPTWVRAPACQGVRRRQPNGRILQPICLTGGVGLALDEKEARPC
jgi:hypothetical protein